ncbi:hypothetical protein [Ureibacillus sp. GCM10028918]|uniref:hypothetical protein n=1 Tax=Ureibacillus sp. GCM10028918 TaxID=3273429 RepID=UPI00360A2118
MLKSLGVLLTFITIALFQIPQLAKEKLTREIVIFSFLMVFTAVIVIGKINNVSIPNPLELIAFTMKPLIQLFS